VKLLADECCDARIVQALRQAGHDVLYVAESLASETDASVLQAAHEQDRLLYTEDADFGVLVVRQQLPCRGVILLRVHPAEWQVRLRRLLEELERLGQRLKGSFTVIDTERTRVRRLPPS
jgi:predicted nuclease of predicted toxin-antitoxin system